MEFASEMLIKSLIHETSTAYVPVSLYPDKPGRTPHLKTWRDGMRHLLRILLYAPSLFQKTGTIIMISFLSFLLAGYFLGIQKVGPINIFGMHSLLLSAFFAILGQCVWAVGLFMTSRLDTNTVSKGIYKSVLQLEEDQLFFWLVFMSIISFLGLIIVFVVWANYDFQFLNLEKEIILFMTFFILTIQTVVNILAAHILKRAE
ncbi:MAG: hypothetical protein JJT78_00155 [Leptospira sp.]|nr:hypothetical protein [Leptospira sp.]